MLGTSGEAPSPPNALYKTLRIPKKLQMARELGLNESVIIREFKQVRKLASARSVSIARAKLHAMASQQETFGEIVLAAEFWVLMAVFDATAGQVSDAAMHVAMGLEQGAEPKAILLSMQTIFAEMSPEKPAAPAPADAPSATPTVMAEPDADVEEILKTPDTHNKAFTHNWAPTPKSSRVARIKNLTPGFVSSPSLLSRGPALVEAARGPEAAEGAVNFSFLKSRQLCSTPARAVPNAQAPRTRLLVSTPAVERSCSGSPGSSTSTASESDPEPPRQPPATPGAPAATVVTKGSTVILCKTPASRADARTSGVNPGDPIVKPLRRSARHLQPEEIAERSRDLFHKMESGEIVFVQNPYTNFD